MKSLNIILLVFGAVITTYFGAMTFRCISVVDKITELKTEHFIILYQGIYEEEAQEVAKNLEENYNRIRSNLNDPDHGTIRVFIHPTQTDFNKATGLLNSTAGGTSRGPNEFHFIWTNWFNSIFPDDPIKTAVHEFVHCVFRTIVYHRSAANLTTYSGAKFTTIPDQTLPVIPLQSLPDIPGKLFGMRKSGKKIG